MNPPRADAKSDDSLTDAVQQTLDEARMVLPGIQALFGFQLIAVFNDGFARRLDGGEQLLHLVAIILVALAAALIMTPAAYHRQALPRRTDERFLELASNFLTAAMVPLALGLVLDLYLVARIILGSRTPAGALAIGLLAVLSGLWFLYPRSRVAVEKT